MWSKTEPLCTHSWVVCWKLKRLGLMICWSRVCCNWQGVFSVESGLGKKCKCGFTACGGNEQVFQPNMYNPPPSSYYILALKMRYTWLSPLKCAIFCAVPYHTYSGTEMELGWGISLETQPKWLFIPDTEHRTEQRIDRNKCHLGEQWVLLGLLIEF